MNEFLTALEAHSNTVLLLMFWLYLIARALSGRRHIKVSITELGVTPTNAEILRELNREHHVK